MLVQDAPIPSDCYPAIVKNQFEENGQEGKMVQESIMDSHT